MAPTTAPVTPQPTAIAAPAPDRADEIRPIVRTILEEAMGGRDRVVQDLQRRLEELERRPLPAPVVPVVVTVPAAAARPAPALALPTSLPAAGTIDMAAIERSIALDPEMQAFDGRRRRLRLVLTGACATLVVFAVLFAALAESYTHAHP